MEMADGVKFKGEYMGSQYSLYVLRKHCDGRNSYLITNYYYYDKRGEESEEPTITGGGWESGDYSQKEYQNWQ
jgi:hypothetical protein